MVKTQMNVKIEQNDLRLARKISSMRGEDLADFVRLSMRKEFARLGFLNNQETKALEVKSA